MGQDPETEMIRIRNQYGTGISLAKKFRIRIFNTGLNNK